MPEMPPQGQAAPSEAPAAGPAEKIASLNESLMQLADETAAAQVPDNAKAALAKAVSAYQEFMSALSGEPSEGGAEGPGQMVSADGGPNGVPMSHGGRA